MPSVGRHAIAVALVGASSIFPRDATATERTSALSWVRLPGAEGCIGAPALAAAVEARLGRRVFVPPSDAEISVEGSIAYRADTKRATAKFRVADRSGAVLGARDLDEKVSSCSDLDERLAFVLSVLVDPEAALGPPAAPSTAPPPAEPPPPTPPIVEPAPIAPRPPPPPSEPWRWLIGADFGIGTGLVPDPGWVWSGGGIVTPPHWPGFRLQGSSFLPVTRRIGSAARAEVELLTGEVGVCPLAVRRRPFGVTACLSGLLGQLSAQGEGFPTSSSFRSTVGATAIDFVAELALSRMVHLTLTPKFVLPLTHARLTYVDDAGARRTIFESAPVGGSVALGVAIGSR
jgi:hypothetical protein